MCQIFFQSLFERQGPQETALGLPSVVLIYASLEAGKVIDGAQKGRSHACAGHTPQGITIHYLRGAHKPLGVYNDWN
ncbi:hypothetical protein CQ011_07440 [Arthrobacter sp. MYb213]|nr:hypothetical protein CQ011_07440 [Arthrobacter sp. MYb213]